jgi:ABC-type nitrate/sulfonate/bicarbonate transport system substrate-binding protein
VVSAGCASTGGSSGTDSKGLMKLRVVQSSTSVGFFALYVAQQEGYFTKEGLDIGSPAVLGGDSKVAAALAGGSADVGGGVATDAFLLASGKRDPKIIANLLNSYYVDVIVGKQFKQPPAGASLDDKIRALKGAKIGVPAPSGGGAALLQFLFNRVGMNINSDITMVNLGASNSGAVGALETHRVDALVFFQPVGQQVVADGIGSIYISPTRGDVPGMTNQPHGVAFTTGAILKEKPKQLAAFVRAIALAEKLIHSDPQKAAALFKTYQSSLAPKTQAEMLPVLEKEIPDTPVLTQQGYAETLRFHQIAGLAKDAPDYATVSGDDFAAKALSQ